MLKTSANYPWVQVNRLRAAILLLGCLAGAPGNAEEPIPETPAPAAPAEEAQPFPDAHAADTMDRVRRTTITLVNVDVRGKAFDDFSNEDASGTIKDWLMEMLNEVPVFNVVSRDDIDKLLNEQSLGEVARFEDTSPQSLGASARLEDLSPQDLAKAGRLARVNYFLYGKVDNFADGNSEFRFYLVDVETAKELGGPLNQRLDLPFNGSLRSIKSTLSRIVGNLAAEFPLETDLAGIVGEGVVDLDAGDLDGIDEDMEVAIHRRDTGRKVAGGYVISTTGSTSRVNLEERDAIIEVETHVARVKIVPPAQAAYNRGTRYFGKGDYQNALRAFDRGLVAGPEDEELWAGKARAHYNLGQYKEAQAAISKATIFGIGDEELLHDAIKVNFEAGDFLGIVSTLKGKELGGLSGQLGAYLGMAYEYIGRDEQARETYRDLARFHPNQADVQLRLGIQSLREGDHSGAGLNLRTAATLDSESSEFRVALAAYEGDAGAIEAAEREGDFVALATAAEVLLALDVEKWADAVRWARDSKSINRSYIRARLLEARALDAGGRASEAVDMLVAAREDLPDSYALTWYAAVILSRGENLAPAIAMLEEATSLAPDDPQPRELMGDVLHRQGQHGSAVGAYRAALEVTAENSREAAELLFKLGRSEVLRQQYLQARDPLKSCTQIVADHGDCYFFLAVAEFHTEEYDLAYTHFQAAQEFEDRHYYVAQIHEKQQKVNEATAELTACVESGSEFREECRERLERIESITAKIVEEEVSGPQIIVDLDVGSVHGVDHGMKARVLDFKKTWIEITKVKETTSSGRVVNAEKNVSFQGREVQFRPNRPIGLSAAPGTKKGVKLTWDRNPEEEEVAQYIVFRSNGADGPGEELKRVKITKEGKITFEDKSARIGDEYYYWVVAENTHAQRSLQSKRERIEVRP